MFRWLHWFFIIGYPISCKKHFSCLLACTHRLCYLCDVIIFKPLVSSMQGMIPEKINLGITQIEYVVLNAVLELIAICSSLPMSWVCGSASHRKVIQCLARLTIDGWRLALDIVMTAIGVFVCRSIDMQAVGICCTVWITVYVYHNYDLRWYGECHSAGMTSSVQWQSHCKHYGTND